MSPRPLTTLAYALLGLLHQAPLSGYALMRTFQTTPMGQYSGSPGAVYPALRKLEHAGLIRGKVERQVSLRPRRVFHLTPQGRAVLRRWLSRPITVDDVALRESELMLRFALMEGLLEAPAIAEFLRSMAKAIDTYVVSLQPYLKAPGMTRHATWALRGGIEGLIGRGRWARRVLRVVAGRGEKAE